MVTTHDLTVLTALTLVNTLMIFSLVTHSLERRMLMPPRIVRAALSVLGGLAALSAFVLSILLLTGRIV